ncbi:DNA-binding transcriptional regulator, PadR family [Devosia enhydra]|uniref:DNA-binding transcriptional regulator, PadR family n=1 Tax=Devosia enhydra TaxID=665118 RepID=A0A1K2HTD6_9HYPH|nr:PadR family transcriptional regulator [Devosia enhydra]SFZ81192.1 DNA-binding transcriptional regulator, PadR family [Devosia enhydra]
MNVRTVCLAILYDGEATGYEIRKLSVEGEYAYFIDASFGSIYPALAKLEGEGLVTSRVELQEGKPSKKVYAITEEGRRSFIAALFETLGEDDFRSEFLLFARFASELPAALVEQRLDERLKQIDGQIKELDRLCAKRSHPGDAWVIAYGRTCMASAREYIAAHRGELVALARQDDRDSKAAE